MSDLESGDFSTSASEWQPTEARRYPTLTSEQQRRAEEILTHRLCGYARAEVDSEASR
jgi:hypothetical protein